MAISRVGNVAAVAEALGGGNTPAEFTEGPLHLRFGTIISLDSTTTCTVTYGGATVSGVRWIGGSPSIGSCSMLQQGRLLFVVGNTSDDGGGGGGAVTSTIYNVKDYGAIGDGVADDSAAILATIAAAPHGSTIYFPAGIYRTNPFTVTKELHLLGDGRFSSWLQLITPASTSPLVTFNTTVTGTGVFQFYGSSYRQLGIDLASSTTATGIKTTNTAGWIEVDDFYIQWGNIGVDHNMSNSSITNGLLADCTKFFTFTEPGLELTFNEIIMERVSTGTTTRAVDVVIASGGIKGAIFYDDIRLNVNAVGGVSVSAGWYVAAPANASVPLQGTKMVMDNCAGPALTLTNIQDSEMAEGWLNAAASTGPALLVTGGGNIKLLSSNLFGGTGGGASSIEFGAGVVGFITEGNTLPTGPIYRMPSSGATPTYLTLNDQMAISVYTDLTNNYPALYAGINTRWTTTKLVQEPDHLIGAAGEPAFTNSWANSGGTLSPLFFFKDASGVVHVEGVIVGGSAAGIFTLPANYRPGGDEVFAGVDGTGAMSSVRINQTGAVLSNAGTVPAALGISCHFRAAGIGF